MSGAPGLPRIILGPQSEGRNHGVLARSAGADLGGAAESALRDFHLRIGEYLTDPQPVFAFFSLPDGPTVAVVSTRHAEVRGNRVWASSAVLLSEAQRRALKPLMGAFAPLGEGASLPALGADLPPWTVGAGPTAGAWPAGQLGEIAAALAPDAPLAAEVSAPQTPLGFLAGLLPLLKTWQRRRLAFITAPAPLQPWTLVAYQAESWDAAAALNRTYSLVRLGGGRTADGGPGDAAGAIWSQLLHGLGEGEPAAQLAETLFVASDGIGRTDEGAAALIQARATAGLRALGNEESRRAAFGQLLAAATALRAPGARAAATGGLYPAFEALALESDAPQAWIEDFMGPLAGLVAAEPPAPLFIGRVALQSGALFRLAPARIAALAPLLTDQAAAALTESLARRDGRAPDADAILLGETLNTADRTPDRDDVWRLATRLARQVALAPRAPGSVGALLVRFLDSCLAHGRDAEYAALLSGQTLDGAARAMGGANLRRMLLGPMRMVREELALHATQAPTRDLVIYALCLRRAGALARDAA